MIPSTFRGRTLDDAQHAARAALGEDAVILTARRVRGQGLRGLFGGVDIEVAATAPPPSTRKRSVRPPAPRGPFASSVYVEEQPRPGGNGADAMAALRQELRSMQGLVARAAAPPPATSGLSMAREIAALRDAVEKLTETSSPRTGAVGRLLRETGIEGSAATELVRVFKAAGGVLQQEAVRDTIGGMVRVAPWPLAEQGPVSIALVGPSGVGKTTTAAKLAGRAMHELGKTVTFVTCDHVRVGAFEQMDRFADLLGAKVVAARTPAELQRAIETAETDLVIVDTAGRSMQRPDGPERLLASVPGLRSKRSRVVLLCLPASVRAADAARFTGDFAPAGPTALAITKIDETRAPAGLLHGVVAAKVPLSVLCFGQNVPEDIAPATMGAVLDYLLPKGAARRRAP